MCNFSKRIQNYIKTNNLNEIDKLIVEVNKHDDSGVYYDHLTFMINDLSDYIKIINIINLSNNKETNIAYRGISNSVWELTSTLQRNYDSYKPLEKNILLRESNMINKFLTRRPYDFSYELTYFQKIAKMQHYALPTRLLDFSENPLIALYFACEKNIDKDINNKNGRVVYGEFEFSQHSNIITDVLCSIPFTNFDKDIVSLKSILEPHNLSLEVYLNQFFKKTVGRPIFIKPLYLNERIINQKSLFLVFPNKILDTISNEHLSVNYFQNREQYDEDKFILDKSKLETMNKNTIMDEFCSVLIESDKKTTILSELYTIGITPDFVCPELEYLAKYISQN